MRTLIYLRHTSWKSYTSVGKHTDGSLSTKIFMNKLATHWRLFETKVPSCPVNLSSFFLINNNLFHIAECPWCLTWTFINWIYLSHFTKIKLWLQWLSFHQVLNFLEWTRAIPVATTIIKRLTTSRLIRIPVLWKIHITHMYSQVQIHTFYSLKGKMLN